MAEQAPILQSHLPWVPDPNRLPGTGPADADDWLRMDEVYAQQMALRDHLIDARRAMVFGAMPVSHAAQAEVLEMVLALVSTWPGFEVSARAVKRPDGVTIALDGAEPALVSAGRLVQEDLCIMQEMGGEYGLTAAVLCFPAHWTLAEKLGRPLTGIHAPVDVYSEDLAKRVERLFRAVRAGHPLCRFNFLAYERPELFVPELEAAVRRNTKLATYIRSERQCITRLPDSGAALFSIHTYMVETAGLDAATYEAARGAISLKTEFPPWHGQGPSRR